MPSSDITTFAQLGLSGAVLRAVDAVGYETPTPIQAAAIGPLLAGRDIIGQAQTGTGKTAAFALPLLSRLDLARLQPQVLVLTPTRELAIQVAEALQTYARHMPGFHVLPIYGGQGFGLQLRPLRRGVHAVVGTPGRILDHLRRGTLDLRGLTAVVLDEADEMLRMGFIDDVESILEQTPAHKQLALFSATLPPAIDAVARRHTRDPVQVRIESPTATVATVAQYFWPVSGVGKLEALTRILEVEDFDAMLVFVRTRTSTAELAERLEARGFSSAALHGDMPQAAREQTIERLRSGRLDILVATDVAARGLDVERISHVVNYDIPYDTEAYVHRIGRTARAGRAGKAILFVAPRERRMLRSIERATGQRIEPMGLPSRADVADRRTARFKAAITETIAGEDLTALEALVESYQAEHGTGLTRIAAALAHMARGDRAPLPTPAVREPAPDEDAVPAAVPGDAGGAPGASDRAAPRESGPSRPPRRERGRDAPPALDRVRYRIEVGATHGVQVKNIVGAIANEAGLDSQHIGPVRILDEHSVVDLPEGMPRALFKHLRKVWVCGRQLQISVLAAAGDPAGSDDPGAARAAPARRPAPRAAPRGKRRPGGASKARGSAGAPASGSAGETD